MSDDTICLTLMVCRDEDGNPLVCGAWESNILDIMDGDEVDELFAKARSAWFPDYIDWREIQVNVSRAGILRSFESPTLDAEINDVNALHMALAGIKEAAIKYGVNDEVDAAIAHAEVVQRVTKGEQ